MRISHRWRLGLLVGLIGIGLLVAVIQPLSLEQLLLLGYELAANPLTAVLLIATQALLFALALPGTLIFWLVAPFYTPWLATVLLCIGGALGALGGYAIAATLGSTVAKGPQGQKITQLMANHDGNFLVLAALRIVPGFPHSVINYGAGTIRLPVAKFLLASTIGLAIKWFIYARAVYGVTEAGITGAPLGWDSMLPLLIIALLFIVAGFIRHKLNHRKAPQ